MINHYKYMLSMLILLNCYLVHSDEPMRMRMLDAEDAPVAIAAKFLQLLDEQNINVTAMLSPYFANKTDPKELVSFMFSNKRPMNLNQYRIFEDGCLYKSDIFKDKSLWEADMTFIAVYSNNTTFTDSVTLLLESNNWKVIGCGPDSGMTCEEYFRDTLPDH